ncbi:hypothetical protein GALMADRAFT_413092 [Galerina marginata CBS 339.88]|uniref:Uncharacterized protein n=1 Tax=Galerina marginata (strain CBS 339.88) TaxID=685588 RepID=A0A067T3M6_GALM3|nr:hypothetical protein GALMADRAFT_413092 [Galerina marginata CBS 339.88]
MPRFTARTLGAYLMSTPIFGSAKSWKAGKVDKREVGRETGTLGLEMILRRDGGDVVESEVRNSATYRLPPSPFLYQVAFSTFVFIAYLSLALFSRCVDLFLVVRSGLWDVGILRRFPSSSLSPNWFQTLANAVALLFYGLSLIL